MMFAAKRRTLMDVLANSETPFRVAVMLMIETTNSSKDKQITSKA